MGVSQAPFSYTDETVQQLITALSDRRFGRYLKGSGHDRDLAFSLYLYNARLAKAFLFPLHIVEIVLRNGVDEVLVSMFGESWAFEPGFQNLLTEPSRDTLHRAIQRLGANPTKDDVVATLTFDFWSNLFRADYDRPLWQRNMHRLLPHASTSTRASFERLLKPINRFRNRIAHHEPIFHMDVSGLYKDILDVVRQRSPVTESWLKNHSTVHEVMRTSPKASGAEAESRSLAHRCDKNIVTRPVETPLSAIAAARLKAGTILVCTDADDRPIAVVDASDIGEFTLDAADQTGLVDLNEHTLAKVVDWANASVKFALLSSDAAVDALPKAFDQRWVKFVLVNRPGDGEIVGVIRKAHRRY